MLYHHVFQFLEDSIVFLYQKISKFNYVTQLLSSVLEYQRMLFLNHILFVYQDLSSGDKF